MSDLLRLMALDGEDLAVISAHVQDAVMRPADFAYEPKSKVLTLPMNRFAWEAPAARRWFFKRYERRLCALTIKAVDNVKRRGINSEDEKQVLSLLSLEFTPNGDEDPSGIITLHCAGEASMRIAVDTIEVQLTDLGAAWEASGKPRHAT